MWNEITGINAVEMHCRLIGKHIMRAKMAIWIQWSFYSYSHHEKYFLEYNQMCSQQMKFSTDSLMQSSLLQRKHGKVDFVTVGFPGSCTFCIWKVKRHTFQGWFKIFKYSIKDVADRGRGDGFNRSVQASIYWSPNIKWLGLLPDTYLSIVTGRHYT